MPMQLDSYTREPSQVAARNDCLVPVNVNFSRGGSVGYICEAVLRTEKVAPGWVLPLGLGI